MRRNPEMIATKVPEFNAQLLTDICVALFKARELGYPVESMDITASVSKGICSVHFAPLADPGVIVAGRDLSLSIDPQTNEVTGVQRGQ
jgi:hypothetical protein